MSEVHEPARDALAETFGGGFTVVDKSREAVDEGVSAVDDACEEGVCGGFEPFSGLGIDLCHERLCLAFEVGFSRSDCSILVVMRGRSFRLFGVIRSLQV